MKNVKLYVEGGGDSKEQHARCREGFRKLLEKSGFSGVMPRIVAGGGREVTFDQFKTAVHSAVPNDYPMLLVDSEEPVINTEGSAWDHLHAHDGWEQPGGTTDNQAHLMVTCMETWIMADRDALRVYFGRELRETVLFSPINLESRQRHAVQDALVMATRDCQKTYKKGKHSFEILAKLHPETLKNHLPHFVDFLDALRQVIEKP